MINEPADASSPADAAPTPAHRTPEPPPPITAQAREAPASISARSAQKPIRWPSRMRRNPLWLVRTSLICGGLAILLLYASLWWLPAVFVDRDAFTIRPSTTTAYGTSADGVPFSTFTTTTTDPGTLIDTAALENAKNAARVPIGVTTAAILAAVVAGAGVVINQRTVRESKAKRLGEARSASNALHLLKTQHSENLRTAAEKDIADRRQWKEEQFSKRFQDSSKQLGDPSFAVRLAGIYSMLDLGMEWPERRQRCVNVLCAYLRADTRSLVNDSDDDVRRSLVEELCKSVDPGGLAWNVRLDWSGAFLESVQLTLPEKPRNASDQELLLIDVSGATFSGDTTCWGRSDYTSTGHTGTRSLERPIKIDGDFTWVSTSWTQLGHWRLDGGTACFMSNAGGIEFDMLEITSGVVYIDLMLDANIRIEIDRLCISEGARIVIRIGWFQRVLKEIVTGDEVWDLSPSIVFGKDIRVSDPSCIQIESFFEDFVEGLDFTPTYLTWEELAAD